MVWGMNLPEKFGEFWPEGDFEYDRQKRESGWRERLIAHYLAQPRQEQKRLFDYGDEIDASGYAGYAIGKFSGEAGTVSPHFTDRPPIGVIEHHEPPQTFDTEKTYKALGSLVALNSGLLALDDELKAIIERLEPGMHQFFPIKIIMPGGVVFPNSYYVLIVGQYFSSFSREENHQPTKNRSDYQFAKAIFGEGHLWRDRLVPAINCFSDELMAEIDKAGLRLPKHYKMKEV